MRFFHYVQTNSGGPFDFNEAQGITHHVVIEANDAQDANDRAERMGIYFNGCLKGFDCSCCGDRWSQKWTGDSSLADKGDDTPMVYEQPVESARLGIAWMKKGKEIAVHYADGRVVWHGVKRQQRIISRQQPNPIV